MQLAIKGQRSDVTSIEVRIHGSNVKLLDKDTGASNDPDMSWHES